MKTLFTAFKLLVVMTVLTGMIYPLLVTGVAQTIWPEKAKGSLITKNSEVIGSELIAQKFVNPRYFWPRPSAVDYNAQGSGGSNLGPTSGNLKKAFDERGDETILVELKTASASGLDPEITPDAAKSQLTRIAADRHLSDKQIQQISTLIDKMTIDRTFGILGERRVNVLRLNLALDENP